jgi:hypothetical protein
MEGMTYTDETGSYADEPGADEASTGLKRKLEEEEVVDESTAPVVKKKILLAEDSSEYESTDSSWSMSSDDEEEDTEPRRIIHTRSRGPAEIVQANAAMDQADEDVDNESDFSSSTEEEEEEDEVEEEEEIEEEDEVRLSAEILMIICKLMGFETERYRRRRIQRRRLVCDVV